MMSYQHTQHTQRGVREETLVLQFAGDGWMLPVDGLYLVGTVCLELTRTDDHIVAAEFSLGWDAVDYLFLVEQDSDVEIDLRESEEDRHWVEHAVDWRWVAERELLL